MICVRPQQAALAESRTDLAAAAAVYREGERLARAVGDEGALGGGFVRAGFGLVGAVSVLNAVTVRTAIKTVLQMREAADELFLRAHEDGPSGPAHLPLA
jgi:hypothetical protein